MAPGLRLSSLCNRRGIPLLDQPQLVYVLTELIPDAQAAASRMPLNFTLLLDHSGSMAGEKLRTMKEAVKNMIDQLAPEDIISVVTFESKTRLLAAAQPAVDKATLKRQVDQIRDAGGTNLAPGLRQALEEVQVNHLPGRVSRIVLLTDGEVTDSEEDSRHLADQAGAMGIPIIGLGFGRDWNEEFLFDLADRSILAPPGSHLGHVEYIPQPQDVGRIFQDVYRSMQVVAREVQLTLRMVQGLEARRVWQVAPLIKDLGPNVIQGRAIVVPVGELERGGAAYLVEMMLPPRPAGAVRIAQAEVTYSTSGAGAQRQAVDLVLQYTSDPALYNALDGRVMNVVEKVQAFKLQTQALSEAQMGQIGSATRKLRQAVTLLLAQGEQDLAEQIQQEAERLEQSGQLSSEGKKTILLSSRKTVRLSE